MTNDTFLQTLEEKCGRKLKIRINNNHSTMLSVKWEPDFVRISLHKMFLKAPGNIMDDLACYIRKKRDRKVSPALKAFIEEGVREGDYTHVTQKKLLVAQGKIHDLEEIYDAVNGEYFDHTLQIAITWYGKKERKAGARVNLGLYSEPLKLIKIHRLLDSSEVPVYVIAYIVYHEMLHSIVPSYVDPMGRRVIHSPAFRRKERCFRFYSLAEDWIKQNNQVYFLG